MRASRGSPAARDGDLLERERIRSEAFAGTADMWKRRFDGMERGIADTLRAHWLTGIHCDHEAKTDVATCYCAVWRSEPQPSVGAAVERWIEHVLASASEPRSEAEGTPKSSTTHE